MSKFELAVLKAKKILSDNANNVGFDEEESHYQLDELLCEILQEEGYVELVEIFKGSPKWYS